MQNRSIILLLALFLVISVTSCTRSTVTETEVEEVASQPMQAPSKGGTAADVMPVENMPDVKIDTSAEIPSDKDITNVQVPDVQIDAAEGVGGIDETHVDAMDDTIDE